MLGTYYGILRIAVFRVEGSRTISYAVAGTPSIVTPAKAGVQRGGLGGSHKVGTE